MTEREWILLNPAPANTSPRVREALIELEEIRTCAFRVSNLGTVTPEDMAGVVNAFAECLQERVG